jgi:hypothetical protein
MDARLKEMKAMQERIDANLKEMKAIQEHVKEEIKACQMAMMEACL